MKIPQPSTADSAKGSESGSANTSVAGTTAYSARPAIEYIATGVPSWRRSRVVPSKSCPLSRFSPKKLSHRSSRPVAHARQNPHGITNAHTTRDPTGRPGHAGSQRRHRAGDFMPHHRGRREGHFGLHYVQIGVAHAARVHLDQDLVGQRFRDGKLLDRKAARSRIQHGGHHGLHKSP